MCTNVEFEKKVEIASEELKENTRNLQLQYQIIRKRFIIFPYVWFFLLLLCIVEIIISYDSIRLFIASIIIPIYSVIHILRTRNSLKNSFQTYTKTYIICRKKMSELADIIDWGKQRRKYLRKEDIKQNDLVPTECITNFIIESNRKFSPYRHGLNYYKFFLIVDIVIMMLSLFLAITIFFIF